MAEKKVSNQADIEATYGDTGTPISFSSNLVTTTIVEGISVVKSADKTYWVDGPLTYTIVVTNNSGISLSGGTLSDTLDTSVSFDMDYGVFLNDSKTSDFEYTAPTLKVNLPTLEDSQSATIKFRVTKPNS